MDFIRFWSLGGATGWKRAARVNSITLVAMSMALSVCFIASAVQTRGITTALLLYEGSCDTSSKLNVALHLLLNGVSTAVLASSNFFMQILNAPSREEVDEAHVMGSWLGIGVPSWRNAFLVSKVKTVCWVLLLLCSIPIHILFNSTVFQMDQRGSDYHLTIASEGFVNGAGFYPPGASLTPAGFYSNSSWNATYARYPPSPLGFGYGGMQGLSVYSDPTSTAYRNITVAAANGAQWDNLNPHDCYNEYINCDGLSLHRDLIVVVDQPDGWARNETWHLKSTQTATWDQLVPANESNSLWFATQCIMVSMSEPTGPPICGNGCYNSLGSTYYYGLEADPIHDIQDTWQFDFFMGQSSSYVSDSFYNISSVLVPGAARLTVKYCLAEPVDRICHVGLSSALLLGVIVCVLVKTVVAVAVTVVLGRQGQAPLVTLGDAIASFIARPDPNTAGMCTVGQREARAANYSARSFLLAGPKQWRAVPHRRWSAVPTTVWLTSYTLFLVSVVAVAVLFKMAYNSMGLSGSFTESNTNGFVSGSRSFNSAVLTANAPQLLLSFCYLAYNNIYTRLQMAKEWARFYDGYHPLRVTDPKGLQYSTYRLQLPYKYSVPLIIFSVFLHWLLSQAIYIFLSEGGYYTQPYFASGAQDSSLPANTAVAIGYSAPAVLGILAVALFLIGVPLVLSVRKLPSNMVNVGSNSIAISAACHASTESKAGNVLRTVEAGASGQLLRPPAPCSPGRWKADNDGTVMAASGPSVPDDGMEMRMLASKESETSLLTRGASGDQTPPGKQEKEELFKQISRGRLRWGVIKMSAEWHQEFDAEGPAEHISFGVEDDEVQDPVHMKWYA